MEAGQSAHSVSKRNRRGPTKCTHGIRRILALNHGHAAVWMQIADVDHRLHRPINLERDRDAIPKDKGADFGVDRDEHATGGIDALHTQLVARLLAINLKTLALGFHNMRRRPYYHMLIFRPRPY